MKVTTKKGLCILNTVLAIMAAQFLLAIVWQDRGSRPSQWIYLDVYFPIYIIEFVTVGICLASCFWNPQEKGVRKWYIVSASLNLLPALFFSIFLILEWKNNKDNLIELWRALFAIAMYFAIAVLYFVIAFVKTKQVDKTDEPIPYSD